MYERIVRRGSSTNGPRWWLAAALAVLLLVLTAGAALAARSPDGLWNEIESLTDRPTSGITFQNLNLPSDYRIYELDMVGLQRLLSGAGEPASGPRRGSASLSGTSGVVVLTIPMPDGSFARFRIQESSILSAALQAQHPELRTYLGQGLDDRTATMRFDVTPAGFHAQLISAEGMVIVDPTSRGDTRHYMSYDKRNLTPLPGDFHCDFISSDVDQIPYAPMTPSGSTLRTYRLAMTATGEYTQFFGGTVANAQAALTTTVNRVNGIYERELSIRLTLVAFNIYTDPTTDPFPTGTSVDGNLLNQNQTDTDANVGSANYDIGHIVSAGGGGGLAQFGVCAGNKAKGGTSRGTPSGDAFDVDYVAHEMGHQFHADHTFNDGATGSCGGGNRVGSSAYEPGSGSTIMAYAGICPSATPSGGQNVQPHSDPFFHTRSFDQIVAFREGGGTCGPSTNTGNTIPTVNAGGDFTIPRGTPFRLTATGSDGDGDALTFCWEQFDLGAASPPLNTTDGPLFRSPVPTVSPTRVFPKMSTVLSGVADNWERLPTVDRDLNFRCTVRDNRAGGGGVNYDAMVVHVSGAPFAVTSPNGGETLHSGCPVTVAWTVGGGSVASNVDILYSSDGGSNFTTLLSNTANDGSESVTLPCTGTSQGRIMVQAVGNIFFDVSDANFTVVNQAPAFSVSVTGGAVDASCERTVTFSAHITDDCSVNASDVSVNVSLVGVGTLGTPSITKTQTDGQTVDVSGSVVVGNLLAVAPSVQVAIDARDGCTNLTSHTGSATVFDDTPPVATCPSNITVECSSHCGTPKDDPQLTGFFAAASATDNCDSAPTLVNDAPACLDVGSHLVTFTATDSFGNAGQCSATIKVVDTTPPVITVVLDRDVLWPPNHKLAQVCATVTVTDICDPNPTWTLTSITSNEPDNGLGDGDTENDIQDASYGTADECVLLRSERSGKGNGRVYTLVFTGKDDAGNTATATVYVRVPHDKNGFALLASGFDAAGTGFAPEATQFTVVVPSQAPLDPGTGDVTDERAGGGVPLTGAPADLQFDARRVDAPHVYVGNGHGALSPVSTLIGDVNADGFDDLVVLYDIADARNLLAASSVEDGPLGIHYDVRNVLDYLVPDLFALGAPTSLSADMLAELQGNGGRHGNVALQHPAPAVEAASPARPAVTALIGVRPNPIRFSATVTFSLARDEHVDLAVYDLRGARVRTLSRGTLGAGLYPVTWDGTDDGGRRMGAGMYFVRFQAGHYESVKRVALAR